MRWIITFFTSSVGRKLIMSLTGLFLILFLIIHLIGNLQLLANDGGEAFNTYAYFMTTNPLIKTVSYGLYFFILLHSFQGIILWLKNRAARSSKYAVQKVQSTWASRNMVMLGILIFAFLCIHMGDFWFKMKFTDQLDVVTYAGMDYGVKDLFTRVDVAYQELWIVIIYLIGMIALAFHLAHGFQSAFQTLGWNHTKYNGLIKTVGWIFAIILPIGFAIIPIVMYLQ
jgi:succinate dehydrogenase / fumarate reductase cytochrome b subunit